MPRRDSAERKQYENPPDSEFRLSPESELSSLEMVSSTLGESTFRNVFPRRYNRLQYLREVLSKEKEESEDDRQG